MPTAQNHHPRFGLAAPVAEMPTLGNAANAGHAGSADIADSTREFVRIWQGFMAARLTLALVLVAMQVTLHATGVASNPWLIAISVAYFASTLTSGLFGKPLFLGDRFNRHWLRLVGLDVLAFSILQLVQGNPINYTPLFALPILLASVLGSLRLALGTAAGVSLLLLAHSLVELWFSNANVTLSTLQAGLTSVGYFAVALLVNQLASRVDREGLRLRHIQAAANLQRQVNELVIGSLPHGVLIVDSQGAVRAANPAALHMLASTPAHWMEVKHLQDAPVWQPLLQLTRLSFASASGQQDDVSIHHPGQGLRHLRVSTRPTQPQDLAGERLCVLFLQDQRELEARIRTEKLASMGRMSTAVAHEIRNPLAAIAQANALLDEDLMDPRHKKLTAMVAQNAQRLTRIVDDILNSARVQVAGNDERLQNLELVPTVRQYCRDWAAQNQSEPRLLCFHTGPESQVRFDADHLRRLLFNLLDNARRFASQHSGSIQVETCSVPGQGSSLHVWSAGPPMDQSVERHLFEPFFSSESRSSGLGLYICSEVCASHGASLAYRRCRRSVEGQATEGNGFYVAFAHSGKDLAKATQVSAFPPWPITSF
ncbi:MAG: ATP-binding protein [Rhodoferax sp.]|nr:ATP-binding protein [Rhodoferax sp.]